LLALLSVAGVHAATTPSSLTEDAERRVLVLTNDLRKERGLQPVRSDSRLAQAAHDFAAYIAKTENLEHDADGSTPPDRAKKRGYNYCMIAENLASEYSSAGFTAEALASNIVRGWSESTSHRLNMLQPDVTEAGIAIASGPRSGEYYAVQMLGRLLSQVVKFRITNGTGETVRYQYRDRVLTLTPKQSRNHESCVNGDVRVEWPGKQQPSTARPKDGERYTIERSEGVYRLLQDR
jgi:uncharacterized protein YkwD